jgi:hypothetical protein
MQTTDLEVTFLYTRHFMIDDSIKKGGNQFYNWSMDERSFEFWTMTKGLIDKKPLIKQDG